MLSMNIILCILPCFIPSIFLYRNFSLSPSQFFTNHDQGTELQEVISLQNLSNYCYYYASSQQRYTNLKLTTLLQDWCNGIEMGRNGFKFLALIMLAFVLTSSATAARLGTNHKGLKHVVKTIKVDSGEYVDCIDIHKQPAFDHPFLVNHTIQLHPSMGTNILGSKNGVLRSIQSWHKNGHCPYDTIPIKRNINSTRHFKRKYGPPVDQPQAKNTHKYAVIHESASAGPETIQGIHATLNIWDPVVNDQGFSLAQLWLVAGSGDNLNTMEVGWQVYPGRDHHDNQPRLFIFWTNESYQQGHGCYDLGCPGFMQTNGEIVIGGALNVSTYGGEQFELELSIQKDKQTGNWWLYVDEIAVGYWPKALFTTLADGGDAAEWGGEVTAFSNQMGSGHFSSEGYQKSCYIRGMKYSDTHGNEIQPNSQNVSPIVTDSSCYDLQMENGTTQELYLFFGGPGCPNKQ